MRKLEDEQPIGAGPLVSSQVRRRRVGSAIDVVRQGRVDSWEVEAFASGPHEEVAGLTREDDARQFKRSAGRGLGVKGPTRAATQTMARDAPTAMTLNLTPGGRAEFQSS